ncbi:MAG: hypothetical protein HY901_00300, partial [Deltaproteobacteria bacterium]|nr:hypothetical protein [Deltaproteobacteria bacterium]
MRFACLMVVLATLVAASPASGAEKVERPVLSLSGANFRPLPLAIAVPLFAGSSASRLAGQEFDDTL